MLDKWTVELVKPPLIKTAKYLLKFGISADQITVIGFLVGLAAVPALWFNNYWYALAFILGNRILDGLDGTLARLTTPTDAGGFLDIVLDFIFYSAIVVGFGLANPETNAIPALILIMSFMGTGSSFLAFAVMAAKKNIQSINYPQKSLYYIGGLTEGTETIAIFVLFCIFPDYFPELAYFFASLCGITTILRVYAGYKTLK